MAGKCPQRLCGKGLLISSLFPSYGLGIINNKQPSSCSLANKGLFQGM